MKAHRLLLENSLFVLVKGRYIQAVSAGLLSIPLGIALRVKAASAGH